MGGIADVAAWSYSLLTYARMQTRLATASGLWLDLLAYDFLGLYLRRKGLNDEAFRTKIRATILQERVTRAGMASVLTQITGRAPTIFEPWNTGDAGAWNQGVIGWSGAAAGTQPGGGWNVASGWDTNASGYNIQTSSYQGSGGAGGWGTNLMPSQVLIQTFPPLSQGVPFVGGWNQGPSAWNGGITEFIDDSANLVGALTEADVYATVAATKPTGVVAWVNIQ